jgi:hypothetical protein
MAGILLWSRDPITKEIVFLFHKTFAGKKVGFWMDCGGGGKRTDPNIEFSAIREFNEETMAMFLFDDNLILENNEEIKKITEIVEKEKTDDVEKYLCMFNERLQKCILKTKDYFDRHISTIISFKGGFRLFLVPSPIHFELSALNHVFSLMKRRKEFFWVSYATLVKEPATRLHPRLRSLKPSLMPILKDIQEIQEKKQKQVNETQQKL